MEHNMNGTNHYGSSVNSEPGAASSDPYLIEFFQSGGVRGIVKKFQGVGEDNQGNFCLVSYK